MNPVFAALVCLALCTITAIAWYVTQPLAYSMIAIATNFLHGMGLLQADTALSMTKFLSVLWGPVLIAFYVLWFLIFGTRNDTESWYSG